MRVLMYAATILLVLSASAWSQGEDWDDCKDANPERSIAGCTRIIIRAKESENALAVAYNNRGVAYASTREFLRALADYTEAARLNPAYARAYYNRGLIYLRTGTKTRALEDFDTALRFEPDYTKALTSRGTLLGEHGDVAGSIEDFAKALDRDAELNHPFITDLAEKIADDQFPTDNADDLDQKLTILGGALKMNPENPRFYYKRALLRMAKKTYSNAMGDLDQAIRLAPGNTGYLSMRCLAHVQAGKLKQASSDCDDSLRIAQRCPACPDNGFAFLARGILNIWKSNIKDAEEDFGSAIRFMPKNATAYLLRGGVYQNLGQPGKALADYRAAAAMQPEGRVDRDLALAAIERLSKLPASPPGATGEPRTADTRGTFEQRTPSAEKTFKPGDNFRDCAECPEMVVLPVGEFIMGSPDNEASQEEGEGPQHRVSISRAIAVGKFEITVAQFDAFAKATNHKAEEQCFVWTGRNWEKRAGSYRVVGFQQTGKHPATCVDWNDAKAYVTWLARTSGKEYRLLTEAEWEYAARAGATTAYSFGGNPNMLCEYGNGADMTAKAKYPQWTTIAQCTDGYINTAPVGSFKPNAFGLHDMHGNVSEWLEDCFRGGYHGAPTDGSAVTSETCKLRVLRGGSWIGQPRALRSASRLRRTSEARYSNTGFRVARTLMP